MSSKTKRFTSALVLFFFLFSDLARSSPALPEGKPTLPLSFPAALGSVQETYLPPGIPKAPFVFHLETAHAHYENALKVKEIIHYLQTQYRVKHLFVEGASEALRTEFLRFFPEPRLNLRAAEALAQKGELTGADLSLFRPGIKATGVEKARLYRAAYQSFKTVLSQGDETESYLENEKAKLDKQAAGNFSKELRELLSFWWKFYSGHRDLSAAVKLLRGEAKKVLALDFEDPFSQFDWPQLTRLVLLEELEKRLDGKKLEEEKKRIPAKLREALAAPQAKLSRESFEEFLTRAYPEGFRFKDYPQLTYFAAFQILQSELEAGSLFAELGRLFDELFQAKIAKEKERMLLEAYRQLYLVGKLLRLELAREEWEKMKEKPLDLQTPAFKAALRFYRLAERRESVFTEKMSREMNEKGIQRMILVTGGFHTEGLARLFKEKKIGFVTIAPRISGETDALLYRQLMLRRSHLEKPTLLQTARASDAQGWDVRSELRAVEETLKGLNSSLNEQAPYLADRRAFLTSRSEVRNEIILPTPDEVALYSGKEKEREAPPRIRLPELIEGLWNTQLTVSATWEDLPEILLLLAAVGPTSGAALGTRLRNFGSKFILTFTGAEDQVLPGFWLRVSPTLFHALQDQMEKRLEGRQAGFVERRFYPSHRGRWRPPLFFEILKKEGILFLKTGASARSEVRSAPTGPSTPQYRRSDGGNGASAEARNEAALRPEVFASNLEIRGVAPEMNKVVEGEVLVWRAEKKNTTPDFSIVRADDPPSTIEKKIKNEIVRLNSVWETVWQNKESFSPSVPRNPGIKNHVEHLLDLARKAIGQRRRRAESVLEEIVKARETEGAQAVQEDLFLTRNDLPQALLLFRESVIPLLKKRETLLYLTKSHGLTEGDAARMRKELIAQEKKRLMIKIYDVLLNLPYGFNTTDPELIEKEKKLAQARRALFTEPIEQLMKLIDQGKTARYAVEATLPTLDQKIVPLAKALEGIRERLKTDPKNELLKRREVLTGDIVVALEEQKGYLLSAAEGLDTYDFIYEANDLAREKKRKKVEERKRHYQITKEVIAFVRPTRALASRFSALVRGEIEKGRPVEYAVAKFLYSYEIKMQRLKQAVQAESDQTRKNLSDEKARGKKLKELDKRKAKIEKAEEQTVDYLMRYYDIAKHGLPERQSTRPVVVFAETIRSEVDYNSILRRVSGHGQVVAIVTPKTDGGEYRFPHWFIFAKGAGIVPVINANLEAAGIKNFSDLPTGAPALVDGQKGLIVLNPTAETRERWVQKGARYEHWEKYVWSRALEPAEIDGRAFEVWLDEFVLQRFQGADGKGSAAYRSGGKGVGLLRLEELILERDRAGIWLDEERLAIAIDEILSQRYFKEKRPLTIRLFDVQGDKGETLLKILLGKDLASSEIEKIIREYSNVRFYINLTNGIPESHKFRQFGKMQLKAIFKAHFNRLSQSGLRILFPNIREAREAEAVEKLIDEAKEEFLSIVPPEERERAAQAVDGIPVGYMIEEVEAVERRDEILSKIEELRTKKPASRFIAIGTSDLMKSILKQEGRKEFAHFHPQLIRDIAKIAASAQPRGMPVTVEGEWANSPLMMFGLVSLDLFYGLKTVWVPQTSQVPVHLELIRNTTRADLERVRSLMEVIINGQPLPEIENFNRVFRGLEESIKQKIAGSAEFRTFVEQNKPLSGSGAARSEVRSYDPYGTPVQEKLSFRAWWQMRWNWYGVSQQFREFSLKYGSGKFTPVDEEGLRLQISAILNQLVRYKVRSDGFLQGALPIFLEDARRWDLPQKEIERVLTVTYHRVLSEIASGTRPNPSAILGTAANEALEKHRARSELRNESAARAIDPLQPVRRISKILVVEDDKVLSRLYLEVLSAVLGPLGVSVVLVPGKREALSELAIRQGEFGLMITNRRDAHEQADLKFVENVRGILKEGIPIIFVSKAKPFSDAEQGRIGNTLQLRKPLDFPLLLSILKVLIAQSQTLSNGARRSEVRDGTLQEEVAPFKRMGRPALLGEILLENPFTRPLVLKHEFLKDPKKAVGELEFYFYSALPPHLKDEKLEKLIRDFYAEFKKYVEPHVIRKIFDGRWRAGRFPQSSSNAAIAFYRNEPFGIYEFDFDGEEAWARGIYVPKFYRRLGVGEVLLNFVLRELRRRGFRKFTIKVINRTDEAQALQRRFIRDHQEAVVDLVEQNGHLYSYGIDLSKYGTPPARSELRNRLVSMDPFVDAQDKVLTAIHTLVAVVKEDQELSAKDLHLSEPDTAKYKALLDLVQQALSVYVKEAVENEITRKVFLQNVYSLSSVTGTVLRALSRREVEPNNPFVRRFFDHLFYLNITLRSAQDSGRSWAKSVDELERDSKTHIEEAIKAHAAELLERIPKEIAQEIEGPLSRELKRAFGLIEALVLDYVREKRYRRFDTHKHFNEALAAELRKWKARLIDLAGRVTDSSSLLALFRVKYALYLLIHDLEARPPRSGLPGDSGHRRPLNQGAEIRSRFVRNFVLVMKNEIRRLITADPSEVIRKTRKERKRFRRAIDLHLSDPSFPATFEREFRGLLARLEREKRNHPETVPLLIELVNYLQQHVDRKLAVARLTKWLKPVLPIHRILIVDGQSQWTGLARELETRLGGRVKIDFVSSKSEALRQLTGHRGRHGFVIAHQRIHEKRDGEWLAREVRQKLEESIPFLLVTEGGPLTREELVAIRNVEQMGEPVDFPILLGVVKTLLSESHRLFSSSAPRSELRSAVIQESVTLDDRIFVTRGTEFARRSARKIADEIRRLQKESERNVNIVFATGKTMIPVYRELVKEIGIDWRRVNAFHLDEYDGLPPTSPYSFAYYLEKHLFSRVGIPKKNIYWISNSFDDPPAYTRNLKALGGADIVILGVGRNGHVAFNESPADFTRRIHRVKLAPSTQRANRPDYPGIRKNPYALTLGMADILEGRRLFVFVSGGAKAKITKQFLEDPVTEKVPASKLREHPNAVFVLDSVAAGLLSTKEEKFQALLNVLLFRIPVNPHRFTLETLKEKLGKFKYTEGALRFGVAEGYFKKKQNDKGFIYGITENGIKLAHDTNKKIPGRERELEIRLSQARLVGSLLLSLKQRPFSPRWFTHWDFQSDELRAPRGLDYPPGEVLRWAESFGYIRKTGKKRRIWDKKQEIERKRANIIYELTEEGKKLAEELAASQSGAPLVTDPARSEVRATSKIKQLIRALKIGELEGFETEGTPLLREPRLRVKTLSLNNRSAHFMIFDQEEAGDPEKSSKIPHLRLELVTSREGQGLVLTNSQPIPAGHFLFQTAPLIWKLLKGISRNLGLPLVGYVVSSQYTEETLFNALTESFNNAASEVWNGKYKAKEPQALARISREQFINWMVINSPETYEQSAVALLKALDYEGTGTEIFQFLRAWFKQLVALGILELSEKDYHPEGPVSLDHWTRDPMKDQAFTTRRGIKVTFRIEKQNQRSFLGNYSVEQALERHLSAFRPAPKDILANSVHAPQIWLGATEGYAFEVKEASLDQSILRFRLKQGGEIFVHGIMEFPAADRSEVRGISAVELPLIARGERVAFLSSTEPYRFLGALGTLGVAGKDWSAGSRKAYRRYLEKVSREAILDGRTEAEFLKEANALSDASRDGSGVDETPVILQIELNALDARDQGSLTDRLRLLPRGSVVVAYDDLQKKDRIDFLSPLMRQFPRLFYVRKTYLGKLNLEEARRELLKNARTFGVAPENAGFLFSNVSVLESKKTAVHSQLKALGFALQFDPDRYRFTPGLSAAVLGEVVKYAKLRSEVRERLLAEGQARGLLETAHGAYSLNLDLWLEARMSRLLSASA